MSQEKRIFALYRTHPGDVEETEFGDQKDPCMKSYFCHSCVTLFELPSSVQLSDS